MTDNVSVSVYFNTEIQMCMFEQVEYKKKYEQTKAHYHVALDTAEQLHHRENAVLHSQVTHHRCCRSPASLCVFISE